MAGRAPKPKPRDDDEEEGAPPQAPPPAASAPEPDPAPVYTPPPMAPNASYDPSNPSGAINVNNPNADPGLPFVQEGETGGYYNGQVTLGAGTSQSQADADRAIASARAQGIPEDFIAQFIRENDWRDAHRLEEAYYSDAGVEDTRLGGTSGGSRAGGGGSGGGSVGAAPANGLGWMPTYTGPTYTPPADWQAPTFTPPPAFEYAAFTAPTLEEAKNEPGYRFAQEEGLGALQNTAAARGTLRGGATLKDLIRWSEGFAEQNYGNVFNRNKGTYDTNRNNAADIYTTNYGVGRDTFDRNFAGSKAAYDTLVANGLNKFNADTTTARDEYAPKRAEAEATHSQDFAEWLARLGVSKDIFNAGLD